MDTGSPQTWLEQTFCLNHDRQIERSRYSDWLRARRPRGSELESRKGQEFSFLHVARTGSGAHPASYQWVPGVKRPRRELRSRKRGAITTLPHTSS
jgi:hypothetical protein